MRDKQRVLIIASWGYPPLWGRAIYRVSIEHPAFRDLPRDYCESCSSTLAIATTLMKGGFEVSIQIFGMDTVVDPTTVPDGISLRNEAEKRYREWFKTLVDTCTCCKDVKKDIEEATGIEVLPGIGAFHGWKFSGTVDHVFNKVFVKLSTLLEREDPGYSWIVLDLTHGINYQMIALLYATIATAILFEKEDRVLILNSVPAQKYGDRCIRIEDSQHGKEPPTAPGLDIADVTRLQRAISFIRSLRALKNFDPTPLGREIKELKSIDLDLAQLIENKIIPFLNTVRSGAAAIAYAGSCIEDGNGVRCPIINACKDSEVLDRLKPTPPDFYEYQPKIDTETMSIVYDKTSTAEMLRLALRKVLNNMCKEGLEIDSDLLEFFRKIKNMYGRRGYVYAELIVGRTMEELSDFLKNIPPDIVQILNGSVDSMLYRVYNALRFRESEDSKALDDVLRIMAIHIAEVSKLIERGIDDRICRNTIAHAGLEYTLVKKLLIQNSKIVKVMYRDRVKELIENYFTKTHK